MMRFMLADVEPFTQIIGRSPPPTLVHCHEPRIIAFAEFGKCFFPALLQQVEVVIETVALDSLAGGSPRSIGTAQSLKAGLLASASGGTPSKVFS